MICGMNAGECLYESMEGEFLRKKYEEAVACILPRSAVIITAFHWPYGLRTLRVRRDLQC